VVRSPGSSGTFVPYSRELALQFSRRRLGNEGYLDFETSTLLHRALRHATAETDAGADLLQATKDRLIEVQRVRETARVAELVQASVIRKRAAQATAVARRGDNVASSAETPSPQRYDGEEAYRPGYFGPRKRPNFYAVRRGRASGIFHSWEECERQTKGVASKFKSFASKADVEAYLRMNY
jgi:hypothetical protein